VCLTGNGKKLRTVAYKAVREVTKWYYYAYLGEAPTVPIETIIAL